MIGRPPSHDWIRGLIGAAIGSGLSQVILFAFYAVVSLMNGDADNVLGVIPVVPAMFFGACLGFAYRFPAGQHSLGWTAAILFASFILSMLVFGDFIKQESYGPPSSDLLAVQIAFLLSSFMMPMIFIVRIRIRRYVSGQATRERCGNEECPDEEDE